MSNYTSVISCDRCTTSKEYEADYSFDDGLFCGDNGDRSVFKEMEILCSKCLNKEK